MLKEIWISQNDPDRRVKYTHFLKISTEMLPYIHSTSWSMLHIQIFGSHICCSAAITSGALFKGSLSRSPLSVSICIRTCSADREFITSSVTNGAAGKHVMRLSTWSDSQYVTFCFTRPGRTGTRWHLSSHLICKVTRGTAAKHVPWRNADRWHNAEQHNPMCTLCKEES